MFEGFSPRTIEFMWGLRLNNQKPWFEAHKDEFQRDFLQPMKELERDVSERIADTYGDHGFVHKLSRIYKDARRLHGDGPYRDCLWFSIERPAGERLLAPMFWFELSPESWSYGMGYYLARPETMAALRERIDKSPKAFEKLILPLSKQEEFVLEGPEYARKKTPPTPKTADWYNKKCFWLVHSQQNGDELFSPELTTRIVAGYEFLMPLYDYFITL